jgi:hypothetical protein
MTAKPPPELGKAGRVLWRQVTAVFTFDNPLELHALTESCRLQDDLALLRDDLAGSPLIVAGSTGQPVESPLLGSIRNAVALQARLLGSIGIDSDAAQRSHAGRSLAAQRWTA